MKPALTILEPGAAASLQDFGRPGLQRFGVPVSGALDTVSLAIANIVAGNPPGTAAIEILGAGLALEVEAESVTLALAGMAGCSHAARPRTPICAFQLCAASTPGAETSSASRRRRAGRSAYLAVAGGFDIAPALGSRSTYRRAALGGYRGAPS